MSIESGKTRVLIATTNGPVEILLLTEEDARIGRSVACIGGTTDTADIDASYHAFVARPTGLVARLFGHPCFRIDLSARIDAGSSWQLGVLTAHALHAAGRLAQERDIAGSVVWATGVVRSVDLTVRAVSHLEEKLARSLDRLKSEAGAGRPVVVAVPSANAAELSADMRAALTAQGIEIVEIAQVQSLWDRLSLMPAQIAPGAHETPAGEKISEAKQRSSWPLLAARLGLAGLAVAIALYLGWPSLWRAGSSHDAQSALAATLAKAIPSEPSIHRLRIADDFLKSGINRAMVLAPEPECSYGHRVGRARTLPRKKAWSDASSNMTSRAP
jgi:hypothetical protein